MGKLIIDDTYLIDTPILTILGKVKEELGNLKLEKIINKHNQVLVTCPHHKEGKEKNPSCYIYCSQDDPNYSYGCFHCFSCGCKGQLYDFIAECFDKDRTFGKNWLIYNFGKIINSVELNLENEILLPTTEKNKKENNLNLSEFLDYHPYMEQRRLSLDVCKKFNVKYDPKTESLVFPVYDEFGNLKLLTKRSVKTKNFYIEKDIDKPVYLLNFIEDENIKEVYVCESQINALYLWSLGYPAIALIGTGTKTQYKILNKSGILFYHLCFDGDFAGDKGATRFIQNIGPQAFVDVILVPRGKDINDLSSEEVKILLENQNI